MKNAFMMATMSASVLSASLMSGCSTIAGKSDYDVVIDSNPSAAHYVITNRAGQKVSSGVTPATVNLKSSAGYLKGESYKIALDKSGYPDTVYSLNSSLSGWYWGNILVGGLIGMLIVDPLTGAMYKLPERADIPMKPGELLLRKSESASESAEQPNPAQADASANAALEAPVKNGKYLFAAEVIARKTECARTVKTESIAAFKEVYSAVCADGREVVIECNGGNCAIQ